jgi:hypothetical protein
MRTHANYARWWGGNSRTRARTRPHAEHTQFPTPTHVPRLSIIHPLASLQLITRTRTSKASLVSFGDVLLVFRLCFVSVPRILSHPRCRRLTQRVDHDRPANNLRIILINSVTRNLARLGVIHTVQATWSIFYFSTYLD